MYRNFDIINHGKISSIATDTNGFKDFSLWLKQRSVEYDENLETISDSLESLSSSSMSILSVSEDSSQKLDNLERIVTSTDARLERMEALLSNIRKGDASSNSEAPSTPSEQKPIPIRATGTNSGISIAAIHHERTMAWIATLPVPHVLEMSIQVSTIENHMGSFSNDVVSDTDTGRAQSFWSSEGRQSNHTDRTTFPDIEFDNLDEFPQSDSLASEDISLPSGKSSSSVLKVDGKFQFVSPQDQEMPWTSSENEAKTRHVQERSPTKITVGDDYGQAVPSLHTASTLDNWTKTLLPSPLAEYLTNSYLMILMEPQVILLEHALTSAMTKEEDRDSSPNPFPYVLDENVLKVAASFMRADLQSLQDRTKKSREDCLIERFRIDEIDNLLGNKNHLAMRSSRCNRRHCPDALRCVESQQRVAWRNSHQRINQWLLDVLISSDDSQTFHRSLLANAGMEYAEWAQLVANYWFLDDAARVECPSASGTVQACDSRDTRSIWSESTVGVLIDPGLQERMLTGRPNASREMRGETRNIFDSIRDQYRCSYCDAVFVDTGIYLHHLQSHFEAVPFECEKPGCTKRFTEIEALEDHIELHTKLDLHMLPVHLELLPPPLEKYLVSEKKLIKLLEALHQHRKLLHQLRRLRTGTERRHGRNQDLRTKEIAFSAVELLMQEKVENAWRTTIGLRWRCARGERGDTFPVERLTSRELKEYGQQRRFILEQRFMMSAEDRVVETIIPQPLRRHASLSETGKLLPLPRGQVEFVSSVVPLQPAAAESIAVEAEELDSSSPNSLNCAENNASHRTFGFLRNIGKWRRKVKNWKSE